MTNFAAFDPHASFKDAARYPVMYDLFHWVEKIIFILVGLFALHMLFWFARSFFFALRQGRDRTCVAGGRSIHFFAPAERVLYVILLISFMGLVMTGLPLKYGMMPSACWGLGYVCWPSWCWSA